MEKENLPNMQTIDYLISIVINYIAIGFIAVFFTMEYVPSTQFSIKDRGKYFWNSFLYLMPF